MITFMSQNPSNYVMKSNIHVTNFLVLCHEICPLYHLCTSHNIWIKMLAMGHTLSMINDNCEAHFMNDDDACDAHSSRISTVLNVEML